MDGRSVGSWARSEGDPIGFLDRLVDFEKFGKREPFSRHSRHGVSQHCHFPPDRGHTSIAAGVPRGAGTDSPDGFDLSRMRALLGLMGNPERSLSVVHVVGTKGKGSTAQVSSCLALTHGPFPAGSCVVKTLDLDLVSAVEPAIAPACPRGDATVIGVHGIRRAAHVSPPRFPQMVAGILHASGASVGLYTSPHLFHPRESIALFNDAPHWGPITEVSVLTSV